LTRRDWLWMTLMHGSRGPAPAAEGPPTTLSQYEGGIRAII
jgi:hypothetical protein